MTVYTKKKSNGELRQFDNISNFEGKGNSNTQVAEQFNIQIKRQSTSLSEANFETYIKIHFYKALKNNEKKKCLKE